MPPVPHLPGEAGVWVFIVGDMLVFGLLFCTYLFYRADTPELFNASQEALNPWYGVVNTVLLLTSSWFVASAVQGARRGLQTRVAHYLAAAWCCGAGFALLKVAEYSEKIGAGITLTTNDFYMYYFVLTGLHCLHLVIGMGVLAFLWVRTRATEPGPQHVSVLESGASFWHLVDLLWIVLFPLIYLVR